MEEVWTEPDELRFGDLVLNEATREVWRAGSLVDLTPTEFNLLRFFLLNPRRVLTKPQILDGASDDDFSGDPSIAETYVSYLRRKLDPLGPPLIPHRAPRRLRPARGRGGVEGTAPVRR